jgi:superfamily II DNA or RNA helicase
MTPRYVPRGYQTEALDAVFDEFTRVDSTLLVMATGTGKTEVFLQTIERFLDENPGLRALLLAHRDELVNQPARRRRRNREEWPGVEMAEQRVGGSECSDLYDAAPMNERFVIASVPTLNSGKRCKHCTADCRACGATGRVESACECADGTEGCDRCRGSGTVRSKCECCGGDGWICIEEDCAKCFEHLVLRMQKFRPEEFGFIVIDETHHAVAKTYARVVRYFRSRNPGVKLLGVTATPDRADEEALGQVFESVAYEYNLPRPILDGWLTPVDQQYIVVDGLNLANVRTTAGDLNSGDLEAEMLAERVLHKVTTPLIEMACGLEPGTIDELIRQNRLHELPGLCTRHEPTLIHAAGVDHAERMTEIINRYLPDSALCIVGKTPKDLRRDGLKRFEDGRYQFLLSCGVFLEGTDLPNVSVIGMARPTKSRALYSQMIGRGLRPLPGLVDGVPDAAERVQRITASAKPRCRVMDFIGNSGKHKLVSAADVLGDGLPGELVEGVKRKAAQAGQPVDVLRALMEAKQKADDERREQARKDALKAQQQQEEAKRRAAARRAGIVAGASYTARAVNPFDVFDVAARRESGLHSGRRPTERQVEALKKFKIELPPDATFEQASQLLDAAVARAKAGLATYSQLKFLRGLDYPNADKLTLPEAGLVISAKIEPALFERQMVDEIRAAADGRALNGVAKKLLLAKPVLSAKRYDRLVNAGKAQRQQLNQLLQPTC